MGLSRISCWAKSSLLATRFHRSSARGIRSRVGCAYPVRIARPRNLPGILLRQICLLLHPRQICLRQIRHGCVSPGKLGRKIRQILRGQADVTGPDSCQADCMWLWGVGFGGLQSMSFQRIRVSRDLSRAAVRCTQRPFVGAVCCGVSAWFSSVSDVPEADITRWLNRPRFCSVLE